MRHAVNARDLAADAARDLGLDPALIDLIFQGAPLDFPVVRTPQLPFRVDRLGIAGITLFGTVYLLDSTRRMAPAELIVLLRHEAEHVRQQRGHPFFYPRYLYEWLRAFAMKRGAASKAHGIRARWYGAYRSIQAELEAYEAGEKARELLRESFKRK